MASSSRPQAYDGPAILSYGFRPLFLLAALQAGLTILLWLLFVSGHLNVPTAFAPVDWHAHEMLFGYQTAAIGGFLLTAIPNWTGRLPVRGTPLLVLSCVWIAGRIAVSSSAVIGWIPAMLVDILFLALLFAATTREIIVGRNWRNLKVVIIVGVLLAANIAFHVEAHVTGAATIASRLAIAAVLFLVALIAGRIVPSFTNNWLMQLGPGRLPTAFNGFDKLVLTVSLVTLVLWVALPDSRLTGAALALSAVAHLARLGRWTGDRTLGHPLLVILHVGYLFVPIGFALAAAASFGLVPVSAGIHAWTAGAFGIMTLAVMSRASLGHTGRALVANVPTQICYVLVVVGTLARILSALDIGPRMLLDVAGLCWSLGFLGFALVYWPVLTGERVAQKAPTRIPRG